MPVLGLVLVLTPFVLALLAGCNPRFGIALKVRHPRPADLVTLSCNVQDDGGTPFAGIRFPAAPAPIPSGSEIFIALDDRHAGRRVGLRCELISEERLLAAGRDLRLDRWGSTSVGLDFDACALDNGGCGVSRFYTCTNNELLPSSCEAIDACQLNNGGCGSPLFTTCTHPPGVEPICTDVDECATGKTAAAATRATLAAPT